MSHVPLGFFYFFTTPPLRQPFRSSFDKQTRLFSLDRWSVFYGMTGLSKQYRPAHWFQKCHHGVFSLESKESQGRHSEFNDNVMEALVQSDSCTTVRELAKELNVSKLIVVNHLKLQVKKFQ